MAPACARRLHDQVPKLESQALEKGKAAAESCLVLGSHVVPHFDSWAWQGLVCIWELCIFPKWDISWKPANFNLIETSSTAILGV